LVLYGISGIYTVPWLGGEGAKGVVNDLLWSGYKNSMAGERMVQPILVGILNQ
jgi:hypothetical protein